MDEDFFCFACGVTKELRSIHNSKYYDFYKHFDLLHSNWICKECERKLNLKKKKCGVCGRIVGLSSRSRITMSTSEFREYLLNLDSLETNTSCRPCYNIIRAAVKNNSWFAVLKSGNRGFGCICS